MFTMDKRLKKTLALCASGTDTGSRDIWKRIDENRQLLELLYQGFPEILKGLPFIEAFISKNDLFFTELAAAVEIENFHQKPDGHPHPFPRPYPTEESVSAKPNELWPYAQTFIKKYKAEKAELEAS